MSGLRLSPDLILPHDFATEGVAVIGMRGSGKSNTEVRFAEVEFEAGIPWAAIDPKGDWWGIRSSADGTAPGLSVPIFGGLHGDFPLEANMGSRIADLLVDENLTAVLDVSHLSKTGGLPQFLTAFCNQLMHRHQLDPHVRTVILEEAHRYIPQSVPREKAAMKEAAASLLLEGRSFGLGCWAASQRPARINKDVLEEVGNALVFRIGVAATNDKKAVKAWTEHYDLGPEIVASLTELNDGQAWVLMPQDRVVRKVQMDRRTTFDSGGTPRVGAASRRPSTLADVDPAAIKEALSDVIERAKADDPKELRRRIWALEKELADRPAETVIETVTETVEVEVPVISDDVVTRLETMFEPVSQLSAALRDALLAAGDLQGGRFVARRSEQGVKQERKTSTPPTSVARSGEKTRPVPVERPAPTGAAGEMKRGSGEKKILTAIAQYPDGVTAEQLSVLTNYKRSSRNTYLQRLKSQGLVVVEGGRLCATAEGLDVLGDDFEPLPTGAALRDYWLSELSGGEQAILAELIDAWPNAVAHEALDEATGYKRSSRNTYLQRLRARQLVETSAGEARASDLLFEDGR